MNYLLYGADTYRSRRKLREIIDAYRTKAGAALNLHRFDAEEDDLSELEAIAGGQSLFASKKLVVIERPFVSARQFGFVRDMLKGLGKDSEVLVVLWDGVIGGDAKKMLAVIEPLIQKVQTFETLQGEKLMRWLKEEISSRGFDFTPAQIMRFAAMGGENLWALHNEMERIVVSAMPKRDSTVRELGQLGDRGDAHNQKYESGANIFQLGDTFFANPKVALGYLLSLLAAGEDEMRVFSYLVGHIRTLLLARAYLDMHRPISPAHKIHPFVAQKASTAVQSLSEAHLVRRLSLFLEEDVKIKTGVVRPEEALVRILISRLNPAQTS